MTETLSIGRRSFIKLGSTAAAVDEIGAHGH